METEVIVTIKTQARHDKEYKLLEITQWNPYRLTLFSIEDSLPSDSIYIGPVGEQFLFKVPRYRPRRLEVLDVEIKTKLGLVLAVKENREMLVLQSDPIKDFLNNLVFTSKMESDWWWTHRDIEVENESDSNLIFLNIVGV